MLETLSRKTRKYIPKIARTQTDKDIHVYIVHTY